MLLNFLILLFLLLMMAVWAHYGLFSAMLHLLAVVIAGSIALALWEPLAFSIQLSKPDTIGIEYAWGAWLLGLFLVILLITRVLIDRIVRGNVQFNYMTNIIGGAFAGLLAGILTAGLTLIGVGFLPLPATIFYYQPLAVDSLGKVVPVDSLWIPVDHCAVGFFSRLSGGSFYSGKPLQSYLPEPATQAALFRLRNDPNASVGASPASVSLGEVFIHSLPLKDSSLDQTVRKVIHNQEDGDGGLLVIVETKLEKFQPPFDKDWWVRVPPTQVRLVAQKGNDDAPEIQIYAPIAIVIRTIKGERDFKPVDNQNISADSDDPKPTFGWVFVIREGQTAKRLFFRRLRLELPSKEQIILDPVKVRDALGKPAASSTGTPAPVETSTGPSQFGSREGLNTGASPADTIELTTQLPAAVHKSMVTTLELTSNNEIVEGQQTIGPPNASLKAEMRVDRFKFPAGSVSVRMVLNHDMVYTTWGRARESANLVGGIFLVDNYENRYEPYAWVLVKPSRQQVIYRREMITSAKLLPISRMADKDQLFVYFQLSPDVTINRLEIGQTKWELHPPKQLR